MAGKAVGLGILMEKRFWVGSLTVIGVVIGLSIGCFDTESKKQSGTYLIRINDIVLSAADFMRAYEIEVAAYPHEAVMSARVIKDIRSRLFNQMIERMILLARAKELGIYVSDSELDKAIEAAKQEYSDEDFDKALLESAISYETWKSELRTRLIMEKVIAWEFGPLEKQIQVSDADIQAYQEKFQAVDSKETSAAASQPSKKSSKSSKDKQVQKPLQNSTTQLSLIRQLIRMEKKQALYQNWMERLHNRYSIEINHDLLNKVMAP